MKCILDVLFESLYPMIWIYPIKIPITILLNFEWVDNDNDYNGIILVIVIEIVISVVVVIVILYYE